MMFVKKLFHFILKRLEVFWRVSVFVDVQYFVNDRKELSLKTLIPGLLTEIVAVMVRRIFLRRTVRASFYGIQILCLVTPSV